MLIGQRTQRRPGEQGGVTGQDHDGRGVVGHRWHGLLDRVPSAAHLFLDRGSGARCHCVQVFGHGFALMPHNDNYVAELRVPQSPQDMSEQRLPRDLVQDLRRVRLHPGPESGGENDGYWVVHEPNCSRARRPVTDLAGRPRSSHPHNWPMPSPPETDRRHRLTTFVAALVVGALVAWQSRINGELAQRVGGGFLAAAISFGTGLVMVAVIVVARTELRGSIALIPAAIRAGGLRPWHLLGGLGGAWLVTTQGLVVTVVGVTIFTIAVVAGQVSGSLFVDRAGTQSGRPYARYAQPSRRRADCVVRGGPCRDARRTGRPVRGGASGCFGRIGDLSTAGDQRPRGRRDAPAVGGHAGQLHRGFHRPCPCVHHPAGNRRRPRSPVGRPNGGSTSADRSGLRSSRWRRGRSGGSGCSSSGCCPSGGSCWDRWPWT